MTTHRSRLLLIHPFPIRQPAVRLVLPPLLIRLSRSRLIPLLLTLSLAHSALAQPTALQDSLEKITKDAQGRVGISISYKASHLRTAVNGNAHFPMQSVFKFPLALKILHDVDKGKISLDRKIHVDQKDWVQDSWSPMRDLYKSQTADIPVREVLRFTVSASDNNGCDLLFKLAGGTTAVDQFIHDLGIRDISIVATEAEMHKAWDVQYRNWCTPDAMTALLNLFLDGKVLSAENTKLLMQFLTATTTGPHRIKGLLPANIQVAHKTGTSDTNDQGLTAATNDVGIITLPNNRYLILSVFIMDSTADEGTREGVIARIAAAACKM